MLRRLLMTTLAALPLMACGGPTPKSFEGGEPRLKLEDYFAGETKAYGIFRDRFGDLRRQFTVDIQGDWNPDTKMLTLDEEFQYADGETDTRVWEIEKTGPHRYRGTAGDVIGEAKGEAYGNAFTWTYKVELDVDGDTWTVTFDDWMFRQSDGIVINTADVSRWGLHVGTVTIVFRKPGAGGDRAPAEEIAEVM